MKLTRDIRCQKCRKLLAKTSVSGKLIEIHENLYMKHNCIEIVCKRCKEKNYIAIKKER